MLRGWANYLDSALRSRSRETSEVRTAEFSRIQLHGALSNYFSRGSGERSRSHRGRSRVLSAPPVVGTTGASAGFDPFARLGTVPAPHVRIGRTGWTPTSLQIVRTV